MIAKVGFSPKVDHFAQKHDHVIITVKVDRWLTAADCDQALAQRAALIAIGLITASKRQKKCLTNASRLKGLVIRATDGEIRTVDQLYFDDESWSIRYFTVEAGGWLGGRRSAYLPGFRHRDRLAGQTLGCGSDEEAVEKIVQISTRTVRFHVKTRLHT